MAKSMRSKWKRKMRAIKRVRYGEKELAQLKLIVDTAKDAEEAATADVDMENGPRIVNLVSRWRPSRLAKKERLLAPKRKAVAKPPAEDAMETNTDEVKAATASTSKYPVWLGSHRRKKLVHKNKAIIKKKKKEIKKNLKKRK